MSDIVRLVCPCTRRSTARLHRSLPVLLLSNISATSNAYPYYYNTARMINKRKHGAQKISSIIMGSTKKTRRRSARISNSMTSSNSGKRKKEGPNFEQEESPASAEMTIIVSRVHLHANNDNEKANQGGKKKFTPTRTAKKPKADHPPASSTNKNKSNPSSQPIATKTQKPITDVQLRFILSPAKTLDTSETKNTAIHRPIRWTRPNCNISKTNQLIRIMKQHSSSSLSKVLGISANLASTAHGYWTQMEEYDEKHNETDKQCNISNKPCIFAFQGAAYQGLAIDTLLSSAQQQKEEASSSAAAMEYLQETLRIVDPLYGWLRPMDVIQPYRLEMATKHVFSGKDKSPKLANYWKPAIAESIRQELLVAQNNNGGTTSEMVIVNVASDEYSAAVDRTTILTANNDNNYCRMIKVIFRHDGRVIAIHAKRARGLFVRYCALHQVTSIEQLKEFASEGYRYQTASEEASASDDTTTNLVFDRSKTWNKKYSRQ
jgi:cytoplasmic iron level regulating protein YaaA (DUF328/UPF0246 family)